MAQSSLENPNLNLESTAKQFSSLLSRLGEEIHVWISDPDSITSVDKIFHYKRLLSIDEQEKYYRYKLEEDRRMYLAAHVLKRKVLSLYDDLLPVDWEFVSGEYGKPEINNYQNDSELRINISHTSGLVAMVVSKSVDCGIDVEKIRLIDGILDIAHTHFGRAELEDLVSKTGETRQSRFIEYWTLKEAYLKGTGKGLTDPLNSIEFSIDEHLNIQQRKMSGAKRVIENWDFKLMRPVDNYRVAVAIQNLHGSTLNVVTRLYDL